MAEEEREPGRAGEVAQFERSTIAAGQGVAAVALLAGQMRGYGVTLDVVEAEVRVFRDGPVELQRLAPGLPRVRLARLLNCCRRHAAIVRRSQSTRGAGRPAFAQATEGA